MPTRAAWSSESPSHPTPWAHCSPSRPKGIPSSRRSMRARWLVRSRSGPRRDVGCPPDTMPAPAPPGQLESALTQKVTERRAMADFNAELFTKLYSKLALALGVTPHKEDPGQLAGLELPGFHAAPSGIERNPQSLIAILNPGQYIPANMDLKRKEDRYALSVLLNPVPQFSWV